MPRSLLGFLWQRRKSSDTKIDPLGDTKTDPPGVKEKSQGWVRQQLREAFPFEGNPRYLIHDNDTIFSGIKAFLEPFGIKAKPTAFQSPWQNGACERILGSLRRELLNHVIPLDEQHLRRLIKEYLRYYHEDRTHLGLDKDSPRGRPQEPMPGDAAKVESLPRCGGLHHRYCWRAAA